MHPAILFTLTLLSYSLLSPAAKIDPSLPPVSAIGNIICTPYSHRSRNPSDYRLCRSNLAAQYSPYQGTQGIPESPITPDEAPESPDKAPDSPESPGSSGSPGIPGATPSPPPAPRCYQKNNQQPSLERGCTKLCNAGDTHIHMCGDYGGNMFSTDVLRVVDKILAQCPGGSGGVFKAEKPQGDGLWVKVFSRPEKRGVF